MAPLSSSASSSDLPAFDGLTSNSGFLLVSRLIDDWGTAVDPEEPQLQASIAHAVDHEGRTVTVAINHPKRSVKDARDSKGLDPAELPHFVVKLYSRSGTPPAPVLLWTSPRSLVMATVGDHALLLIDGDLFLYDAESMGLARLKLLPPYPLATPVFRARAWHSHRKTTGLVRVDDRLAVVSLLPPEHDSTGWGGLLRWFSSTGIWEVKSLVLPSANMRMRVQRIDSTVPLGNGIVCWTDYTTGMVLVNVFQETPSVQCVAFPPGVASFEQGGYSRNTVSLVDGRVTLISSQKNSTTVGYDLLLFELDMETALWAQKGAISIPWAAYFIPRFPTINTQDPRLIYFLEHGSTGRMSYLHGINTKSKPLTKSKERAHFACTTEQVSATAPWVTIKLTTRNEGDPLAKRQRDM